jgi:hypothetical protein
MLGILFHETQQDAFALALQKFKKEKSRLQNGMCRGGQKGCLAVE